MKLQRVIGLLFLIFLNVAANIEETKSQIIQLLLSYIKGVSMQLSKLSMVENSIKSDEPTGTLNIQNKT